MRLWLLQGQALHGLATLWYAAGVSQGLLPALPGQQQDILPQFYRDMPLSPSSALKDGHLGYTNGTITWQAHSAAPALPVTGYSCMPAELQCP